MSGAWPTSPGWKAQTLASFAPTLVSKSINGYRHSRQVAGQVWRLTAAYPPMFRAQFAPVTAFAAAQRGQFETFTVVPPEISVPQGNIVGSTPLVNGASQTGRLLITDGWANDTLVMKAGDLFKVATNDKVYMVTADGTSDGSGNLTLAIEPALVASPGNNDALTVTAVPFTMSMLSDIQEFRHSAGGFFTFEVDFEEVLS